MVRKGSRVILALAVLSALPIRARAEASLPSLEQVLASPLDLWGEAALKQPGGPSYEFFAGLVPPLRYVETSFHVYPYVLSAPGAPVKARLVADGSAINALARQPNWRGEGGLPVTFRVGIARALFGQDARMLDGPKLADGYLPIVETKYRIEGKASSPAYREECFADVDADLSKLGVALVKFELTGGGAGDHGKVEAQFEGAFPFTAKDRGVLRNERGQVVACFDLDKWKLDRARNTLTAELASGESAVLAIYTVPADLPIPGKIDAKAYDERRARCAKTWNELVAAGATLDLPEPVVQNAWRGLLVGSYSLLTGDEIRYSHGNQYAKLYIAEGGDAARSLMLFGHTADAARMMTPLFRYTRKNLEFHQAAFKLQMLAHQYKLTRDATWANANGAMWQKEIDVILKGREPATGMLPREKYCGDIDTLVYSLNSNANCWRALRDMSVMLADLGETARAADLAKAAAEYRSAILAQLDKAIRRDVAPPFMPIALSGEEQPYANIDAKMPAYWNLMTPYVLGSGVFRAHSQTAADHLEYMRKHGSLVMGMETWYDAPPPPKFWMHPRKTDDLYGMRYALTLLERDEPDRALVSFYGKLAQGMTRDTFVCPEGADIKPLDEFGRLMYLPPNSAGNASFLQQLRYILVQDYDLDDDGREETLRLAFATPRAWLADGKRISVRNAPTAFGDVSYVIESAVKQGRVEAQVDVPAARPPQKMFLRLRLPDGPKLSSVKAGDKVLPISADGETIDMTGLSGHVALQAQVAR
jgi:hypothetical protein